MAGNGAAEKRQLAIPLCLPSDYHWDSQTGECVHIGNGDMTLYVVKEAVEKLREIESPVCVVSIAGPPRSGKSYLLSEAFDQPQVFPVGHRMEIQTIGIWLWIIPEKYQVTSGRICTIILLDSQAHWELNSDMEGSIFLLTVLLSSVLIYNYKGVPRRHDLEIMDVIKKTCQKIKLPQKGTGYFNTFPRFIWLLRDIFACLPGDCSDFKEYFFTRVLEPDSDILRLFNGFDAFALTVPAFNVHSLRNMNKKSDLNPQFFLELTQFKHLLMNTLVVKHSVSDEGRIDGEGLAALVEVYVEMLNRPAVAVDMQLGWEKAQQNVSRRKIQKLERRNRELEEKIENQEKELYRRALQTIVIENKIHEQERKHEQIPGLPFYKMKRCQRGMCVIINNVNFRNKTWYRKGAAVDERELKKLFEELFFTVVVRNDLKWDEMRKVAADYAAKDHSEFDAFVLVVMSHGGDRDVIYGVEGRTTTVEDLMSEFNATNCPTLRNKPKLFFIQTCRGELKDESNAATLNNAESDHSVAAFSPDSPLPRSVCPQEADFLLAFSTTPGYVAYRNEQHGSPYIQTLVEVMRNRHNHDHVLDMLTEVNRLLAERSSPAVGLSGPVQVPAPVHTLRAKLYL